MPLSRLRSAFSSRHPNVDQGGQHSGSSATTTSMTTTQSAPSPQSWSSTHQDFTSLRFFVWTGGDPGFTLTTDRPSESSADSLAFDENAELRVGTVTAAKVWEAGVRPGDILETVSGKRVHTMDAEAALVLVQMSKSPSVIRFRSATSGTRKRFDVLLRNQKLGVFFTGDGCHDIPVVTRISSRSSLQDSSHDVVSPLETRLGDVLVAVNGRDAIAAGLNRTSKYLETCPRPLKFTFERRSNSEWFDYQAGSEGSAEEHRQALSSLHRTISGAAVSALAARETASLRCKAFLKTLMPKNMPSTLSPVHPDGGHCIRTRRTRDEVVIEWKSGPLGLMLLEDAISGVPIVNRLTGNGLSANMERLQHGFQLYSINGVQVGARSLEDLYQDLLTLPKPVILIFCPLLCDGISDGSSESPCSASSPSSSPVPDTSRPDEIERAEDAHQALTTASAVQHRRPEVTSSIGEQYEYEVVWTSARLGLKLDMPHDSEHSSAKTDKTGGRSTRRRYPMVHEVLKESTLGLPTDAVGHLFVSIDNWRTSGLTVEELRTLLGAASKPALLRFRRQEVALRGVQQRTRLPTCLHTATTADDGGSTDSNKWEATGGSAYSIVWREGKLGIVFGCYEEAEKSSNTLVVYVKSIGPGQALKSRLVGVGDILHSINGRALPPKQNFKKAMRALIDSSASRPVTLGFRRMPWSARSTGRSNSRGEP